MKFLQISMDDSVDPNTHDVQPTHIKFNPHSAASLRTLMELILGILQVSGVITEKREGYDLDKDMPKDKDSGEPLF